jgi:hypothetical protein
MSMLPKVYQIERGKNPSYLNSLWLCFWGTAVYLWTLFVGTFVKLPLLYLFTVAVGFAMLLVKIASHTLGVFVTIGKNLLYGVLGGLVSNEQTFNQWLENRIADNERHRDAA